MPHDQPVHRFNAAIVRAPARSVVDGLRAEDQGDPDYEGVVAEHRVYTDTLKQAGLAVTELPALDGFPDSLFVEDPALVFTEGAIILRPGAASRLGEAEHIRPVLSDRFETVIDLPDQGFADGGDVLATPERVMIGLSSRTDRAGAEALIEALRRIGRTGEVVATPKGVLHFKSDCSLLDDETVLSTARLAASGVFDGLRQVILPEGEEHAANSLRVNDVVLVNDDAPRTMALLEREGYRVVPVRTGEIRKIDAGLSCMSLRWFDSRL